MNAIEIKQTGNRIQVVFKSDSNVCDIITVDRLTGKVQAQILAWIAG